MIVSTFTKTPGSTSYIPQILILKGQYQYKSNLYKSYIFILISSNEDNMNVILKDKKSNLKLEVNLNSITLINNKYNRNLLKQLKTKT